ncbi:MAG: hypothetical protein EZS28_012242 [Streblomastix strix]|uniref:Uncharacterized protein n=1 Tax=Streblomastix strix TaxID=222440 RepID=A0A5J4WBA9_9EUKA|nr:MAG: hypothetical protein EZS28_012242 [Streblomastix strix]
MKIEIAVVIEQEKKMIMIIKCSIKNWNCYVIRLKMKKMKKEKEDNMMDLDVSLMMNQINSRLLVMK